MHRQRMRHWTCELLKLQSPTPVTHFLQQGHTYPTRSHFLILLIFQIASLNNYMSFQGPFLIQATEFSLNVYHHAWASCLKNKRLLQSPCLSTICIIYFSLSQIKDHFLRSFPRSEGRFRNKEGQRQKE